jgi:hypothetical protein
MRIAPAKDAGRMLRGRTHDAIPKRVANPLLPAGIRLEKALEVENQPLIQLAI